MKSLNNVIAFRTINLFTLCTAGIDDIKAITGFIWQQPTIQYVIEH